MEFYAPMHDLGMYGPDLHARVRDRARREACETVKDWGRRVPLRQARELREGAHRAA